MSDIQTYIQRALEDDRREGTDLTPTMLMARANELKSHQERYLEGLASGAEYQDRCNRGLEGPGDWTR